MTKVPKETFFPFEYNIPPPVKIRRNYLFSNPKSNVIPSHVQRDRSPQTPYINLAKARRESFKLENVMKEKNVEFEERRKSLREQWEKLAEKEKQFQNTFIQENHLVTTNLEKRKRAKEIIIEQRKRREKYSEDIDNLKIKCAKILEINDKIRVKINEYAIYENYLEQVVLENEEFKHISDILKKFETYMTSKSEVRDMHEETLCDLENDRTQFARYSEKLHLTIMGLFNRINDIQHRYNEAKFNTTKLEIILHKIKENSIDNICDIEFSKLCIWNMYKLMCNKQNSVMEFHKNDTENQLNFIKHNLGNIIKVRKKMKKSKNVKIK